MLSNTAFGRYFRIICDKISGADKTYRFASYPVIFDHKVMCFALAEMEADGTYTLSSITGQDLSSYSRAGFQGVFAPMVDAHHTKRGNLGKGLSRIEAFCKVERFAELTLEKSKLPVEKHFLKDEYMYRILQELKWPGFNQPVTNADMLFVNHAVSSQDWQVATASAEDQKFLDAAFKAIRQAERFSGFLPSPPEKKYVAHHHGHHRPTLTPVGT